MVRNVLGSLLALAGAASAVYSPYEDWYGAREGRHYRVADLFGDGGITGARPELYLSLLLPFAAAALLALVGIALRLRPPVAVAGLVVLGFTVLWLVREALPRHSLTVNGDGTAVDTGVGYALGGGLVLLLAAVVMSGRPPRPGTTVGGVEEPEPVYGGHGGSPVRPGAGHDQGRGAFPNPYRGDPYRTDPDTATLPTVRRPGDGDDEPPAWHRRPTQ